MQSCLDFDDEYSTLNSDQDINTDEVFHGTPDSLNYRVEISEQGLDEASTEMTMYFRSTITGQYCMLGGKEGSAPGSHAYQYQYICMDGYAHYAVVPHYYFAYSADHNYMSTYYINTSFNPGPSGRFLGMKNAVVPALNHPLADSIPEMKAINLLIYDYGAVEMVDIYGAFPYQQYKENRTVNPYTYQGVEDVYMAVAENLDSIIACLSYYEENRPDWYKSKVQAMVHRYGKLVMDFYNGKTGFDTWIRFANSLKLRMAMRMVKVKPELAKQWAEDAVAGGVIEAADQQVCLTPMNDGFTNPILEITKTWNDSRLCASFESLLMSLDHPYTKYMFAKNGEDLKSNATGEVTPAGTRIVGLRAGGYFGVDQQYAGNQYVGVSQVIDGMIAMAPLYLIKWAEIDFLRAEGALRGWDMGGDAQFFYERGIQNASLVDPQIGDFDYEKWLNGWDETIVVEDEDEEKTIVVHHPPYMDLEEAKEYTNVDPFGDTPDMPSVTKIGVKWNDGDDRETKLEKIITQKYIALYPNSYEAWAEMRR
ncbi:MAG: SusD/RagB family nutrient-binding outer membrane lipoprotein, partial [Alloprevotella sp.]|nr:SusD/RagB family nutrient-binding outer membrane lipoprotein [Alloprevotella sp.]